MKILLRNHKGFTFTELLLVLSIIFMVSTALIAVGKQYTETHLVNGFLRQLTLDLYAVQSHAMSERKNTTLQFVANGTEYVALGNSRELLFRRAVPKGIALSENSPMREVSYHPNGAIVKFGTIQFRTDKGNIHSIRLQFGKGRVALPE